MTDKASRFQLSAASRLKKLANLEARAERGALEFASALVEIHKSGLYKLRAETWEGYYRQQFGESSRAGSWFKLQQAQVSTIVGAPVKDAWARELARFGRQDMLEIFSLAQEQTVKTTSQLRDLIAAMPPKEQAEVIREAEKPSPAAAKTQWRAQDRQRRIEGKINGLVKLLDGLVDSDWVGEREAIMNRVDLIERQVREGQVSTGELATELLRAAVFVAGCSREAA